MTAKSVKKAGKAKSAAKPSTKAPGELAASDLQAVTGGLASTHGVSPGLAPVCVTF